MSEAVRVGVHSTTTEAIQMPLQSSRTLKNNKKIATLCVGYCFSSALLAIVNKWALLLFPFPSIVTALQYSSSAIAVTILGRTLEWWKE